MSDAIEDRMKQYDETTVTQLVKMLGECGFKILTHTVERARKKLEWSLTLPSYLVRIFSMIHWGTAIECNCSNKRANSNTSTFMVFMRCNTLTIWNFGHKRASLIVGTEFTNESCVRRHRFSKEFCTPKEKSLLVCKCKEGDPNGVYAVRTNVTRTVQIEHNNDLLSFQLHLIINFVLTERKLAHGPVKFPAHSIGRFAMNIIMAKTCSTTKVNSAKWHIFSNLPKYLPAKISGHMVFWVWLHVMSYICPLVADGCPNVIKVTMLVYSLAWQAYLWALRSLS